MPLDSASLIDSVKEEPQAQCPSPNAAPFPIVGIGASAGGLEALRLLMAALPVDTGMAFVVVQHLSPDHPSRLTEILSRATQMTTCEVCETCGELKIEPNHIYVIPPAQDMTIADGKLKLLPQERRPLHHGIDQFLLSLAEDCGHKAIGVILSGFASDGTLGLEAIKTAGGTTFAQDESAKNDSMPRSAVESGCVDFVLSPEGIAEELARIAHHPYVAIDPVIPAKDEKAQARIATIVLNSTGVDFTHYKSNTLRRRVARRMMLLKTETFAEYELRLQQSPGEVEALFQDFLIGVTSFFRDPAAFESLTQKVFPKLLADRTPQDPVRIWTLGCSTGEEAYSLAMVFTECAEAAGSKVPLHLFATDLNAAAIAKARIGLYPKTIAQVVSPERLQRFFTEEPTGYRVRKALREGCVFSRHDVLDDPPFSRVDLISCRNLLIYMEPVLQQRIMPLLHYALKPGGFLWLGHSETAGTSRVLFEPEDARQRIYSRRPGSSPPGTHFRPRAPGLSGFYPSAAASAKEVPHQDLHKEAERILLTKYAPPGVMISPSMEILQYRGDTGAYLAPAPGMPSLQLLKMLRDGLLVGVRSTILRAEKEGRTVRTEGLRVKSGSGYRELAVEVIPVKSPSAKDGGYLVLFDEGFAASRVEEQPAITIERDEELARLNQELSATREYLQSVIEQQESINEELQSANEEAQSANEEMQSVNEELETSREEIQSTNEELATVNDELNNRNEELNHLNDSLTLARNYAESIVASVRSPLIVLDAALRVKTASIAFYETFLVTPIKTEGRLIYDLGNGQWNIPALRTLLEELLPQEERIHDFEVRHVFEQIGPRIMLLNARRLAPAGENEPLIVLAIEDVSGRRALEESLVNRAADLVRADRSKDEFLAMLAHELRNPLAPLRNAAEILHSSLASDEERGQAQVIVVRQIENMTRMIDDLLDVSRITEGKIELRKHAVSLETILTAAANNIRPGIEARAQIFELKLPAEPIFLTADATRLEQVFGNLLGNACKYSDRGCCISLSAERAASRGKEPEVIVRVRDNGMGIAPDLMPRIFELFVQATRALDRAHGGLGIGLTLVHRLVQLHGGSVEASSPGLGLGSEFTVRLPILPSTASTVPIPVATLPREAARRMLIVDDNQDSARTMAMLQRLRGHTTRTAFDGEEALTAAANFHPEVVLLDIGLPGMDGYEVARELRLRSNASALTDPSLPRPFLVAISGYGSPEDIALARESGFDEYLIKPPDLALLRTWLRNLPTAP